MGHGYFEDEHGDKSSSRLMSFISLMFILGWMTKLVWYGTAIPDLPWPVLAIPIGFYFIGKMGQATADAVALALVGRVGIQPPPEKKP